MRAAEILPGRIYRGRGADRHVLDVYTPPGCRTRVNYRTDNVDPGRRERWIYRTTFQRWAREIVSSQPGLFAPGGAGPGAAARRRSERRDELRAQLAAPLPSLNPS